MTKVIVDLTDTNDVGIEITDISWDIFVQREALVRAISALAKELHADFDLHGDFPRFVIEAPEVAA